MPSSVIVSDGTSYAALLITETNSNPKRVSTNLSILLHPHVEYKIDLQQNKFFPLPIVNTTIRDNTRLGRSDTIVSTLNSDRDNKIIICTADS